MGHERIAVVAESPYSAPERGRAVGGRAPASCSRSWSETRMHDHVIAYDDGRAGDKVRGFGRHWDAPGPGCLPPSWRLAVGRKGPSPLPSAPEDSTVDVQVDRFAVLEEVGRAHGKYPWVQNYSTPWGTVGARPLADWCTGRRRGTWR